jgi:hypothetical protein
MQPPPRTRNTGIIDHCLIPNRSENDDALNVLYISRDIPALQSSGAFLAPGRWRLRQSIAKGRGRTLAELTAPLDCGTTANSFGHPVGRLFSVHMDRARDTEMLAVGQGCDNAASIPVRVAGGGLGCQHDSAALDLGGSLRANAVPVDRIESNPDR